MNEYCVVTTINFPTKAIEELHSHFGENLIIVGDKKTPKDWNYKDSLYISPIEEVEYAPFNHYARKNVGYMEAIKRGAKIITEGDDDTAPNENRKTRNLVVEANEALFEKWFNVYDVVGKGLIWPRGFSLKHIKIRPSIGSIIKKESPIQQGLINGEPDVDAIFRLTSQDKGHYFNEKVSVYLPPNTWCPFNSQNTTWFPVAYPLLYLPKYCTMRMTDIWRSFVAQRCIWELDMGITFHSPADSFQDRNEHDLLKDFEDEIPGYLYNDQIVEILGALILKSGEDVVCENMITCYRALVDNGILPEKEIDSLKEWVKDYEYAKGTLR